MLTSVEGGGCETQGGLGATFSGGGVGGLECGVRVPTAGWEAPRVGGGNWGVSPLQALEGKRLAGKSSLTSSQRENSSPMEPHLRRAARLPPVPALARPPPDRPPPAAS